MKITKKNLALWILGLMFCVGATWLFLVYKANTSINKFRSEDWQSREHARKTLDKIGKPAVGPLITALEDNDAEVRWRAAYSLGEMGDTRAIEPLAELLKDEDRRVCYRAIEALGKIESSQAAESIITVLTDENPHLRNKADRVLVDMGEPAVDPLIYTLRFGNNREIRMSSAGMLRRIYQNQKAKKLNCIPEALIDVMLDDDDCCIRNKIVEVLDEINWGAKNKNEKITQLIAQLGWDVCIKLGGPAIEVLINKLQEEDEDVQQKASSALIEITGKDFGTNFYRWRMWSEQKKERDKDNSYKQDSCNCR